MTQRRSNRRLAATLAGAILALCAAGVGWAQPVRAQTVASGLEHPWALAFLPEGHFLVTERPGRIRVVAADGKPGAPIAGLPEVVARGQGGMLDVATDSGFATNRTIYICYSEPGAGGNSTALARAHLAPDGSRLESLRVLFSARPKVSSTHHFGCRIALRPSPAPCAPHSG